MKFLSFGTGPNQVCTLLRTHLHIGRAPYNGLVLPDPHVAGSHALVRLADDRLLVEDLGSEGGTFVDGTRIDRPTELHEHVRIGPFVITVHDGPDQPVHELFLEEVTTGIRHPLGDGSFLVGDAPAADILVPDCAPQGLRIVGAAVWLGGRQLTLPWTGEVGGIQVRIFALPTEVEAHEPTLHIDVSLEPPQAVLTDRASGAQHVVTAPNRVALLYYLAQALHEDRDARVEPSQLGWRSDEDVAVAVWGREGRTSSRNRLNTLAYRLRTELGEAGIDGSLLEKMAGWMRLHGL